MDNEVILKGEKVILRPLVEADVPLLTRWLFDPGVLPWLQLSEDPPELRTEGAVTERFVRMQADPWTRVWRIDAQATPIGQIELVNIHPLHRRAEMHMAIGEAESRGGGFGRDALRTLLHHAFKTMRLRRVFTMADADNAAAIASFGHAGFNKEGVLRAHRLRHGQPIDMMILGVLREDFLAMWGEKSAG